MWIFREHVENRDVETGITGLAFKLVIFLRKAEQIEKVPSRISAGQQFRDQKTDSDVCRQERAFPALNIAPEGWRAGVDALSNKIAERGSRFQTPLFPCGWYPLKLRPDVKNHRHVIFAIEPCEQIGHSGISEVFGAQDRKMISLSL